MKILFCQKMHGVSGSELYLLQIMPELKKRGYQVEMLLIFSGQTNKNEGFVNQLEQSGITCHEFYNYKELSPILIYKIAHFIKTERFDLVQTNLIHADLWLSLVKLFFIKNLKILSVKHGYSQSYCNKYGYDLKFVKRESFYWIEKFASWFINFNVVISNGLYNVYVKSGIMPPQKATTVYYGLTLDFQTKTPPPQINEKYLLIIGRLIELKGHKYLIEAFSKIVEIFPDLKLYIAGDGELREQLQQFAISKGLGNSIEFLGHVANPHPLIENCLFTVVTSTWEGFGLILLESWKHKKPIVVFDAPAMNEIIDDGKNGLVAKEKDSEDLYKKILYLLKNPDKCIEFGENGYFKLNSYYTLKRMTDEMEKVYKFVLQG